MAGLTRGTLPPSVYWRRRLFVLGLLAAVVILVSGVVRGVTGGGDDPGSRGADVAEQAAAQSSEQSSPSPSTVLTTKSAEQPTTSPTATPLPAPEGECAPDDVVAEPVIGNAVAGRDVPIILKLHTATTLACTFEVAPSSLAVKVTRGDNEIWASRHCATTIPKQDVVVRRDTFARVSIRWDAKRSDEGCSRLTQWAMPGWYTAAAATLGGEPTEVKFELAMPTAATVTPEPKPQPAPSAKATTRPTQTAEPELHETQR